MGVARFAADLKNSEVKKQEENTMSDTVKAPEFRVAYVAGPSFKRSYFVASDGKKVSTVRASRVIPVDVQKEILSALETTGKDPENVISLDEVSEQIKTATKTVEAFETWAADLPLDADPVSDAMPLETAEVAATPAADAAVAAASAKEGLDKKAEYAINEAELPKAEKMSAEPVMAVDVKEAEAGLKLTPPTSGSQSSKVSKFYARLPKGVPSSGPAQAINPQSTIQDRYDLMVKALEEEKMKRQAIEMDFNKVKQEKDEAVKGKGELEDKVKKDDQSKQTSAIINTLVSKKLISDDKKAAVAEILKKIDEKVLANVAELMQLLGGGAPKPAMPPANPFGGEKKELPPMGGEKKEFPPMPEKKEAAANLPPIFQATDEVSGGSAISRLSDIWNK